MSAGTEFIEVAGCRLTLADFQESVRKFLYGGFELDEFTLIDGLRVLIVDDEPYVCDTLKLMFSLRGIVADTVGNGAQALKKLQEQKFDLVVTDYSMPGMRGDELAGIIKQRELNLPVLMVTAYAEMLAATNNPLRGVDFLVGKPFRTENIMEAIGFVLPTAFRQEGLQWWRFFYPSAAQVPLSMAGRVFREILDSMRSTTDVAELMIRHKAKGLVSDYITSLNRCENLRHATLKLRSQLTSLLRFSKRVSLSREKVFVDYVTQVLQDLRIEHRGIQVDYAIAQVLKSIHLDVGTVALLSLIVCELIDNAVDSLNGKGLVRVELDVLASKQCLHIRVSDNGPGVPNDAKGRIFNEQYSTRGEGRGLGLQLVMEGLLKLGGQIEYAFDGGAVFKALVPLAGKQISASATTNEEKAKKGVFDDSPNYAAKVAFSYSHKDEVLRNRLETHLSLLKRQGMVSTWHDRKIMPGGKWAGIIDDNFRRADLILVLVSADFLASDYCQEIEMQIALEREARGEATVVPVVLRACDWQAAPFGKLQALPKDAKPVTSWSNRDEAWSDVANGIKRLVNEIRLRRAATSRSCQT